MYDDLHEDAAVFDFDELSNQLLEQGLQTSPSELHGCLCGLLCAGAASQPEAGLDALGRALDLVLHGELAGQAMALYAVSAAALEDEEFDFHPLLPGDDAGIHERTEALVGWSRGFLAGFAYETGRADRAGAPLSGDRSEILRDFAAITQAEVDEEAGEEESEASFTELVEYLRFAALNVFLDNCADNRRDDDSPGRGQPVH